MGLFRILSFRLPTLPLTRPLSIAQQVRSVKRSAYTWPQRDERFPFEEEYVLDGQRLTPESVIDLLAPLVTPERLAALDKVLCT